MNEQNKNTDTPKQKAIREAYGEYWGEIKDVINENGWFDTTKYSNGNILAKIEIYLDLDYKSYHRAICRPKSLKGIEDNNGWIRINDDSDLPSVFYDDYWVINKAGKIFQVIYNNPQNWLDNITHYQLIIKPNPPIY